MRPADLLFVLVFLLLLALVVLIVVAVRAAQARRRVELQAWAHRNGFRFEGDRPDIVAHQAALHGRKTVRNVLSGYRHGYRTLIYDHRHVERNHPSMALDTTHAPRADAARASDHATGGPSEEGLRLLASWAATQETGGPAQPLTAD